MSEGCFAHAKVNSMRKGVYAFLYAVCSIHGLWQDVFS
jgi:desulfoferrodoxin (superoxide reductase-like protein)